MDGDSYFEIKCGCRESTEGELHEDIAGSIMERILMEIPECLIYASMLQIARSTFPSMQRGITIKPSEPSMQPQTPMTMCNSDDHDPTSPQSSSVPKKQQS